ncbi:RecB family exonuclease [Deinococcus knuensis]|uniref:PD-(D/E)XK endonuclease-like domain-containing protein n=1 Tax=Deinococcus knuensis TaxID=1837380 RepID=A0ABQ2SQX4_9DEIO|nr:PD-(D/E)XK nuclease family protein [Deinococcus knuensis]GGS37530.1 hypothetical protein GCM10008961_31370 [Deinococcus knuensis]
MRFTDTLTAGNWTTPTVKSEVHIRKYSTTGDILSYKRCKRQYGMFGVRGFALSNDTQAYFGTLTHDVLDAVNREFQATGTIPGAADIHAMIEQAHDRLWRSGVRPHHSKRQRESVALLITRFVELVGDAFFRHVQATEYQLERAMTTPTGRGYVLTGVVDVLAGAVCEDLGLSFPTHPDDVEIWDYKSGRRPAKGDPTLRDYEFQMRMYARIFELRTGRPPSRCVLVFLGELADHDSYAAARGKASRVPDLFYALPPEPLRVHEVETDFHATVDAIEHERTLPYSAQWAAPTTPVDGQTCEACDLRFNCPAYPQGNKLRREPL